MGQVVFTQLRHCSKRGFAVICRHHNFPHQAAAAAADLPAAVPSRTSRSVRSGSARPSNAGGRIPSLAACKFTFCCTNALSLSRYSIIFSLASSTSVRSGNPEFTSFPVATSVNAASLISTGPSALLQPQLSAGQNFFANSQSLVIMGRNCHDRAGAVGHQEHNRKSRSESPYQLTGLIAVSPSSTTPVLSFASSVRSKSDFLRSLCLVCPQSHPSFSISSLHFVDVWDAPGDTTIYVAPKSVSGLCRINTQLIVLACDGEIHLCTGGTADPVLLLKP